MTKTQIEQNKTSHLNPHQRLSIQAARGGAVASNVGRMLEDGMDSSSEKNDVVRHDVSRRIPVVCWEARHLAASKSFPSPSSSRACPMTSSMPSIRDPPRANIVKRTTSFRPKHAAEGDVLMNRNLARLKSFSRLPLSRHAPTLRRLERVHDNSATLQFR